MGGTRGRSLGSLFLPAPYLRKARAHTRSVTAITLLSRKMVRGIKLDVESFARVGNWWIVSHLGSYSTGPREDTAGEKKKWGEGGVPLSKVGDGTRTDNAGERHMGLALSLLWGWGLGKVKYRISG